MRSQSKGKKGFSTGGGADRHAAGSNERRRLGRAVVEAVESRILMSASYTMTPVVALDSSAGYRANPLIMDSQGNMYGTTGSGGPNYLGTIFEIPAGTTSINVLASFDSSTGGDPVGKLVRDADGNLFGATTTGGPSGQNGGTIFELPAGSNTISVLASFDSTSGVQPTGLVGDGQGNLFGFTSNGGSGNLGTVFELPAGENTIQVLTALDSSAYDPTGAPLIDSQGNLFGNTQRGGTNDAGAVFELPAGSSSITTLASLDYSTTGYFPGGGLVADAQGNLYGSTGEGGPNYSGTVFKVDGVTHDISTLTSFSSDTGQMSDGTLLIDGDGNLFGTTQEGGANYAGTVFELPAGQSAPSILGSFDGNTTGYTFQDPIMMMFEHSDNSLLMDGHGNLFGVTAEGGANYYGAVYELSPVQATQVVVTQQPADATAGATDALTIKLEDAQGNVDTSAEGDVTVSIAGGPDGAILSGTTTVTAVNGVATFGDLSFATAGDYTLTIDAGNLTSATSDSFTISPGAAAKLDVTRQPTIGSDGHSLSPVRVAIEDAYGNLVADDSSTVSASLGGSGGTLNGTADVAAVNGVATFSDLALPADGTYTLNFSDASLTAAHSDPLTVAPDLKAGAAMQSLTVDLGDQSHKNHQKLHATLVDGPDGAKLLGRQTVWTKNGQASFDSLKFNQAGQYTVQVTDSEGNVVTTRTVNVAPAEPDRLVFVQPPTIVDGVASASVEVLDQYGNVVTDDTTDITLRVGRLNLPISARMDGAVTVTPANGVATFSNFTINRPPGTYRLVASANGHNAAHSQWFKLG